MVGNHANVRVRIDFEDAQGRRLSRDYRHPLYVIACDHPALVGEALERAQRAADAGRFVAGFVNYESASGLDRRLDVAPGSALPLVWFGVFREWEPVELEESQNPFHLEPWRFAQTREQYVQAISRIRREIARGVTYQLNYTTRLNSVLTGDALGLYEHLYRMQDAPYCAFVDIGSHAILSLSPELFFRVDDGRIRVQPMKGTAARGETEQADACLRARFASSEKDRAENLMIVDLLRNDLGKVSEAGTVEVPRLFAIETYPTVFQMTSTVVSKLRRDIRVPDVFRALFPCGSITGAPKQSTMKLICELEDSPREIYCGAVGVMDPGGQAVFNVAIRTLWVDRASGDTTFGVGGGITWDSKADQEYREILTKSLFLTQEERQFALFETMLVRDGRIHLLKYHLRRLGDSGRTFGFEVDVTRMAQELSGYAAALQSLPAVLKLTLHRDGSFEMVHRAVAQRRGQLWVTLADRPVKRDNVFLYHKTTKRPYEDRVIPPDSFDALNWNTEGEITEFTIGNVVVELGGELVTPPVESGLLPGTLRQYLLDQGIIRERVVHKSEIRDSCRIWFLNSVRGMLRVHIRNR